MASLLSLCAGGAHANTYGAPQGGIVGVIGGPKRPRLSADSTAIALIPAACVGRPPLVKIGWARPAPTWARRDDRTPAERQMAQMKRARRIACYSSKQLNTGAVASKREFKDNIYEQLARVGKAVAAPKRLELLDLLCQGPRTVEALSDEANMSVANTSQHLKVLRMARLVDAEKKGLHVEYSLSTEEVAGFYVALQKLGEARLLEVQSITHEYLQKRGVLEAVDSGELLRRVKQGEVTVLDVRPSEEYRAGHIPGALSMPVSEIRARIKEIPKDRPVVAYCRGPYCVMAIEAVQLLKKKGFCAERMEAGVADWRARGFRVEREGRGTNA